MDSLRMCVSVVCGVCVCIHARGESMHEMPGQRREVYQRCGRQRVGRDERIRSMSKDDKFDQRVREAKSE